MENQELIQKAHGIVTSKKIQQKNICKNYIKYSIHEIRDVVNLKQT